MFIVTNIDMYFVACCNQIYYWRLKISTCIESKNAVSATLITSTVAAYVHVHSHFAHKVEYETTAHICVRHMHVVSFIKWAHYHTILLGIMYTHISNYIEAQCHTAFFG